MRLGEELKFDFGTTLYYEECSSDLRGAIWAGTDVREAPVEPVMRPGERGSEGRELALLPWDFMFSDG